MLTLCYEFTGIITLIRFFLQSKWDWSFTNHCWTNSKDDRIYIRFIDDISEIEHNDEEYETIKNIKCKLCYCIDDGHREEVDNKWASKNNYIRNRL